MVDPIDPSGFNMEAQLYIADTGETFPLWIGGALGQTGRSDGELPGDVSGFFYGSQTFHDLPVLQSINIELNLGLNGKIAIEIGAPFDLGLALLESQLFTIGNTVQVRLGYPKLDRYTGWFGGMNAKPSLRIDPDSGLTATLNIEGAAFASIRSAGSDTFANRSYQNIMRTIAQRHGWDVIEPADDANFSAGDPDPYTVARQTVSQGYLSDFIFLQHIARQAGMDFWLGPSPISSRTAVHLARRNVLLGTRPKYTFVARGRSDFVTTFPLFSFESQAEGVWLPRGAGLVRSADIVPDNREESAEESTPQEGSVTANAPAQVGDGGTEVGDVVSRARLEPDAQTAGEWYATSARDPMTPLERIRSHSTEQSMRGGINATISAFGIPDLVPTDVIRVEELGVFSGNYGVQGVSHQASAGEWKMTLTLLSNATALGIMAEHLQADPPSFNAEVVPADPANGEDVPVEDADEGQVPP